MINFYVSVKVMFLYHLYPCTSAFKSVPLNEFLGSLV